MDRNVFNKAIEQLEAIASRHNIDILKESCQRIIAVRDSFEMKVLFVGHFSSGKSSLINELIGKGEYLEEGQNPTTALIRELRASDPGLESLAVLSDYVIVDTPGFDSPESEHTRALASYLGEGGAYVVVSDVTRGDLDPTTLNYIDEISEYTDNIAVVLNRCDRIGPSSRDEVQGKVKETLENRGYNYPVVCLSRHDPDVREHLTKIIQNFDGNLSFQRRMKAAFLAERGTMLSSLQIALRRTDTGTWQYDVQLGDLRNMRDRIQATYANERESLENGMPQQVDAVMADIRTALEGRADVCAELLLAQDAQALEAVMLTAVRPVILRHAKDCASSQIDSLVHKLDFSGAMDVPAHKDLMQGITDTLVSTKTLIEAGTLGQALDVFNRENKAAREKAESANRMYKAVTGITAILTDVIAPWAEVVIVLLPEIVGLCKTLFGATEHEIARDRYLKRVTTVVVAKLYLPVEAAIRAANEALIRGLEQECGKRIALLDAKVKELEGARQGHLADEGACRVALERDIKQIGEMQQLEVVE